MYRSRTAGGMQVDALVDMIEESYRDELKMMSVAAE
jgi:hypothetical protein